MDCVFDSQTKEEDSGTYPTTDTDQVVFTKIYLGLQKEAA